VTTDTRHSLPPIGLTIGGKDGKIPRGINQRIDDTMPPTDDFTPDNIDNYVSFVDSVKQCISDARIQAVNKLNSQLIKLYWQLGQMIVENQERHGWGKNIVERLANDLKASFPSKGGYSPQNLWYMRQFYLAYKDAPKLQQAVGEIPWGQNLLILSKLKDAKARQYYIETTKEMGWSRKVLLNQIKSDAYQRHTSTHKQNNFKKTLPVHLAEQATDTMKDIYILDMLNITEPVLEAELEQRMVQKIKAVMLELGYGFAFIGNQYRIAAEGHEYFIDLLFFNRRLKSLVALELKTGKFKPEYAGKMNFYLNLLNEYVREKDENPAIGIILCADKDNFEVEFSLRDIAKPMGIAEYQLVRDLPKILEGKMPNATELEDKIRLGISIDE